MSITIYSIGHGSRPLEEFIALLTDIRLLVDVRAYPMSRRHPHFAKDKLSAAIAEHAIEYQWRGEELGGLRKPKPQSSNSALNNRSFRAYADHMQTAGFAGAIDDLIDHAQRTPLAMMCAERLPWQCHRYLISDYLIMRGAPVVHLIAPGKSQPHRFNALARVDGGVLVYDRNVQADLASP